MTEINIATFGCWNEGCQLDSGQQTVANLLRNNQHKYNFMIILGDNYYGDKLKLNKTPEYKVNIINENIMKQGFDCIQNINLPKKLIMGLLLVTQNLIFLDTFIYKLVYKSINYCYISFFLYLLYFRKPFIFAT